MNHSIFIISVHKTITVNNIVHLILTWTEFQKYNSFMSMYTKTDMKVKQNYNPKINITIFSWYWLPFSSSRRIREEPSITIIGGEPFGTGGSSVMIGASLYWSLMSTSTYCVRTLALASTLLFNKYPAKISLADPSRFFILFILWTKKQKKLAFIHNQDRTMGSSGETKLTGEKWEKWRTKEWKRRKCRARECKSAERQKWDDTW